MLYICNNIGYIHSINNGLRPITRRNTVMNALSTLTLSALAATFNDAIVANSLPLSPVTKFASKDAALKRIEKVAAEYGLTAVVVDGVAALTAKPVKAAKAKKAAKATGGKRGPAPEYADTMVISVLVANPKRAGSQAFARFAGYKDGMTVGDAIEAGLRRDDFRWDTKHGYITIA